jgi:hypothetical protein
MRLRCEHRIPLEAEAFWSRIHSPGYEALAAEAIGLREYRELRREETADAIYRCIHVLPTLPESLLLLARRLGGGDGPASYVEEQWRSRHAREVRWKITPSFGASRVRIEGVVRVEPVDAASCRRILDGVVEVRFPGLGRLVERAVVATTIEAYRKSADAAARLHEA